MSQDRVAATRPRVPVRLLQLLRRVSPTFFALGHNHGPTRAATVDARVLGLVGSGSRRSGRRGCARACGVALASFTHGAADRHAPRSPYTLRCAGRPRVCSAPPAAQASRGGGGPSTRAPHKQRGWKRWQKGLCVPKGNPTGQHKGPKKHWQFLSRGVGTCWHPWRGLIWSKLNIRRFWHLIMDFDTPILTPPSATCTSLLAKRMRCADSAFSISSLGRKWSHSIMQGVLRWRSNCWI